MEEDFETTSNMNQNNLEELMEHQEQAVEELQAILASCNNIDAVMEEVALWQDKYNIIDIDIFFIDNSLRIKVKNLLSQKFEEFKKNENNARELINIVCQKKSFYRVYDICVNAKNYKNFEESKEKLNDWLKDHPKDTWDQFNDNYKKYFEKYANEDYLKSITGAIQQETIMSSLEDIVDYSIRYSNYQYFQENIEIWMQDYPARDDILNSDSKNKVDELIKDCYTKLTPSDVPHIEFEEFDNVRRCYDFSINIFFDIIIWEQL